MCPRSWKTMNTSTWTPKTSACLPLCPLVRGCWQPWRPSTALRPTTGRATGRARGHVGALRRALGGDGRGTAQPLSGACRRPLPHPPVRAGSRMACMSSSVPRCGLGGARARRRGTGEEGRRGTQWRDWQWQVDALAHPAGPPVFCSGPSRSASRSKSRGRSSSRSNSRSSKSSGSSSRSRSRSCSRSSSRSGSR